MSKKIIDEEIDKIDCYELDGSFDRLIERVQHLKEFYESRYGEKYSDIRLDFRSYSEYYDPNVYYAFFVCGKRYETDEEYENRLADEERQKKYKYDQFLKLQEEFKYYETGGKV